MAAARHLYHLRQAARAGPAPQHLGRRRALDQVGVLATQAQHGDVQRVVGKRTVIPPLRFTT